MVYDDHAFPAEHYETQKMTEVLKVISGMKSLGYDFEVSVGVFSRIESDIFFFAERSRPERYELTATVTAMLSTCPSNLKD